MTYRDVVRRLGHLGCAELPRRTGGSHRKWYNPETNHATAVPDWGARDLKVGTVHAVVRQLGLDWKIFLRI